ncbi:thiamine-phosphate kinase [Marinobacter lacisalsi]|uniref:Thiamine-monophosphate kinase n=1 Tax=Marinobacter lacisalsi TaxID=475979 RepID=A0ABV8QJE5_9GAMM
MGEFELIRALFHPLAEATRQHGVVLGPGDDCAIQRVPQGHELVFSIDTLVAGVHFPSGYDPAQLGWRSLAVAVSDLAAMGADPVCYTLALTLPEADSDWVTALVSGLREASFAFGIALAGGDITRGPLTLTLQVQGTVPEGQAIRRSGARPGDLVAVSGPLGGAAAALAWLDATDPPASVEGFLARYHHPMPRCALGRHLRGVASAAIDISDGLVADLGHILEASSVGAELEPGRVPRDFGGTWASLDQALYGGDDYELCVTLAPAALDRLPGHVASSLDVIGRVCAGSGLRLVQADGIIEEIAVPAGYDHFKGR